MTWDDFEDISFIGKVWNDNVGNCFVCQTNTHLINLYEYLSLHTRSAVMLLDVGVLTRLCNPELGHEIESWIHNLNNI